MYSSQYGLVLQLRISHYLLDNASGTRKSLTRPFRTRNDDASDAMFGDKRMNG